jgi:hypothetical protein
MLAAVAALALSLKMLRSHNDIRVLSFILSGTPAAPSNRLVFAGCGTANRGVAQRPIYPPRSG